MEKLKIGKCPNCKGEVVLNDPEHNGPCCYDCVDDYKATQQQKEDNE